MSTITERTKRQNDRRKTQERRSTKTIVQTAKEAAIKKRFFLLLMIFLGTTSYMFGQDYLSKFYWGLLGDIKVLPQGIKEGLFPVLGGISALLLTTCSYGWWKVIKGFSTTSQQYDIALYGEYMSLIADITYTAISLFTTVAGDMIQPEFMAQMQWAAVLIFILLCTANALLKHGYEASDIDRMRTRLQTKSNGIRESEKLAYQSQVELNAIKIASGRAQDDAGMFANALSTHWLSEMTAGLGIDPAQLSNGIESKNGNDVIVYPDGLQHPKA